MQECARVTGECKVCLNIPVDLILDDTLNHVVHVFNDHADEGLSVNDEVVSLLILALTR